jgi:hypothetical protein
MLRVKAVVFTAVVVTIALVFFPLWLGVTITVLAGAFGLSVAVLGAAVAVDPTAGVVSLRLGLLFQRIRLTDITAVIVDKAKVSIGRASGGEISFYAWRQGRLDALLGLPVVASDVGHAISRAATAAQSSGTAGAPRRIDSGRTSERTRSRLATAMLAGAGALAIAGSLLVRVHWHNPALTVISVVIALVMGIAGLLYLLVALWILLTGRAPRFSESA